MTSEEKQEIINAVLAALRTNSKSIDQLTPVSEMLDADFLELNGGRKVSYGVLFANHMSNDDAQEAWEYLDANKVDKDSRGLVEVHQAPVVYLDAMGNLDGHSLNGSEGLEYRTDTKLIYDFPGGLLGAPKQRAVYISKNNFKKFVWNGTDMVELKADECPLFVDYSEPVAFATLPVGGSYYVPSSHKIAVKIDASSTKTYDPLPDALYFFRDKGKVYTWNSSTNKWVPVSSDINVVNNLTAGGEADALSAEMGLVLRNALLTLYANLGEYAFPEGKPDIDWGGSAPSLPTYSVQKTIGTGLSATGGDADVTMGDRLEVSIAITDNLYIVDDDSVVVTMGGSPVRGAWNASTMKVTIAAVTGNVVINVPSLTYVGYGEQNSPLVLHLDGKNMGSTANQWRNLCNENKPLVLSGGYTKNTDSVTFNGSTGTGSITGLDISVPYDAGNNGGAMESVFSQTDQNDNQVIALYGDPNSLCNTIISGTSIKTSGNGTVADGSTPSGILANYLKESGQSMVYGVNQVVHLLNNGGNDHYLNNVALVKSSTPNSGSYSFVGISTSAHNNADEFWVSGYTSRSNSYVFPFKGSIYAIRAYSRKLTDQERAHNHKVDVKRFNIQ